MIPTRYSLLKGYTTSSPSKMNWFNEYLLEHKNFPVDVYKNLFAKKNY